MEWLLGISVVFNILLSLLIAALIYGVVNAQNEAFHNHQRWEEWEGRWWEMQAFISDEFNCHISPSGLKTKIKMTKHKD